MKLKQYTIKEIEGAIYNQLVYTHSEYKYMVEMVFSMLNQKALVESYNNILTIIKLQSESSVVLGLSKLIDTTNDPRIISFKLFIKQANKMPRQSIMNKSIWSEFLCTSKIFLNKIPELKRQLDPLRNKYYAHLKPASPDPLEFKSWEYWRKTLEEMENIYDLYQHSLYETTTGEFCVFDLDSDIKDFLKWCRLNEYEEHRKEFYNKRRQILL